jgi:hypothetical protein
LAGNLRLSYKGACVMIYSTFSMLQSILRDALMSRLRPVFEPINVLVVAVEVVAAS